MYDIRKAGGIGSIRDPGEYLMDRDDRRDSTSSRVELLANQKMAGLPPQVRMEPPHEMRHGEVVPMAQAVEGHVPVAR